MKPLYALSPYVISIKLSLCSVCWFCNTYGSILFIWYFACQTFIRLAGLQNVCLKATFFSLRGDVQPSCTFENKNVNVSQSGLFLSETGQKYFQRIKSNKYEVLQVILFEKYSYKNRTMHTTQLQTYFEDGRTPGPSLSLIIISSYVSVFDCVAPTCNLSAVIW